MGHLAISAPVLNALTARLPNLHLTVRSRLPTEKLQQRIQAPFQHIDEATDFGFVMVNALAVDIEASASAYRRTHAGWEQKIDSEAGFLQRLGADHVLTNVSYLPLAGAARAGIPATALCPLNWAALFKHFFGHLDWALSIHAQMLSAYRSARAFLRTTPGMPMEGLDNIIDVGPIAALGKRHNLGLGTNARTVLVAMGGIDHRLPIENWPRIPNVSWLVPHGWNVRHPDAVAFESFGLSFTDLLCSVDAVLTKPGYGTFVEAVCNGTPVVYQKRLDWPEQDSLVAWLKSSGRSLEVTGESLEAGRLAEPLAALWAQPPKASIRPSGSDDAADFLEREFKAKGAGSRIS